MNVIVPRRIAASFAAAVVAAVALASGCGGGSPVDVSGDYSVSVTNGQNGCNFTNWTVGQQTSNIDVVVTQTGANATATVNGAVGAALTLAFGSNAFSGTVDGSHLSLTLTGTRSATMGSCAYTVNGTLDAGLNGDFLSGTIVYVPDTNKSSDCGTLASCHSQQDFNGNRPPQ